MSVGGWLFIVIVVLILFFVAWGIFGRNASGITTRPWSRRGGPGEAQVGAEITGDEQVGAAEEGRPPMSHGTR